MLIKSVPFRSQQVKVSTGSNEANSKNSGFGGGANNHPSSEKAEQPRLFDENFKILKQDYGYTSNLLSVNDLQIKIDTSQYFTFDSEVERVEI